MVFTITYLKQTMFICNVISPVQYVLCLYISTFRRLCTVTNKAGFCIFFIPCFPGILLRYSVSDFDVVSVNQIITGIAFVFNIPNALNFYYNLFIY